MVFQCFVNVDIEALEEGLAAHRSQCFQNTSQSRNFFYYPDLYPRIADMEPGVEYKKFPADIAQRFTNLMMEGRYVSKYRF